MARELLVLLGGDRQMPKKNSKRSWKMERASVSRAGSRRARSNKYRGSDAHTAPKGGSRARVWVGGYTRGDGTKVAGHYREVTP